MQSCCFIWNALKGYPVLHGEGIDHDFWAIGDERLLSEIDWSMLMKVTYLEMKQRCSLMYQKMEEK